MGIINRPRHETFCWCCQEGFMAIPFNKSLQNWYQIHMPQILVYLLFYNLTLKRHWLFKIEKLRNPDRVFKDMLTFSFTWASEKSIGLSFDKALSFLKLVPKIVAKEAVEIILKLCTHFLDPPLHDMQTIHFIIFFRAVFIFRIQHYLGEDTSLLL